MPSTTLTLRHWVQHGDMLEDLAEMRLWHVAGDGVRHGSFECPLNAGSTWQDDHAAGLDAPLCTECWSSAATEEQYVSASAIRRTRYIEGHYRRAAARGIAENFVAWYVLQNGLDDGGPLRRYNQALKQEALSALEEEIGAPGSSTRARLQREHLKAHHLSQDGGEGVVYVPWTNFDTAALTGLYSPTTQRMMALGHLPDITREGYLFHGPRNMAVHLYQALRADDVDHTANYQTAVAHPGDTTETFETAIRLLDPESSTFYHLTECLNAARLTQT